MEALEWFLNQGRWAEVTLVALLAIIGLVVLRFIMSVAMRVVVIVVSLALMAGGLYLLQGLRERRAHIQFEIVADARVINVRGKGVKLKNGQKCRLVMTGRYLKPKGLSKKNLHKAYLEAKDCKVTLNCSTAFDQTFDDEYARCLFMLGRGFVRYRCDPCKGSPSLQVRPYKKRAYLRVDTTKPHSRATFRLKFVKTKPHKL